MTTDYEGKKGKTYEEDSECDYCHGKGWYTIDGERFDCECTAQHDEVEP